MPSVWNINIRPQTGSENTYIASWEFDPVMRLPEGDVYSLDHYVAWWQYDTGDGIWFDGGSKNVTETWDTYNPPSNTNHIRIIVTPVALTHVVNDVEVAYWNGEFKIQEVWLDGAFPKTPSVPTVEIDKYTLTASVENISDERTDQIKFEVYNDTDYVYWGVANVIAGRAEWKCTVAAGAKYRVRCVAINLVGTFQVYGSYTDFSSAVTTIPLPPEKLTNFKAISRTSIHLTWTPSIGAKTYDIQYSTKLENMLTSSATEVTGIDTTTYTLTGLESGNSYYFAVRAVNEQGESEWRATSSWVVALGYAPSAPSTWSSTTTATVGDELTLYWVHNSKDGSSQTYAEIELTINGNTTTIHQKNFEKEDEKDKTSFYKIDTSSYTEGTVIKWRVRTAGVAGGYGDWSIERKVDIYAPATVAMSVKDSDNNPVIKLTKLPFYISASGGPATQTPVSYYISVTANVGYETTDQIGNVKMVSMNEKVYERFFDTSEALKVEISAQDIDLKNGVSYTVSCMVSMNSGLTATATQIISVNWEDVIYQPNAEIGLDTHYYCTYVRPYAHDRQGNLPENVLLSIYRHNSDGTYLKLADGIQNGTNTYVTDPHPALDYARYRIIATDTNTGAISYYDPPGYPVNCKAIVIQWNETWSNVDTNNPTPLIFPILCGSQLILPYNIDVSESNSPDVSLVEYIGRSHSVAYYGTQIGTTSTWNVDIAKDDSETLYQLRRLQNWMGDVYAREPSGTGYWANIKVSFGQTHCEVTIPVTIELTRVEGGI